MYTQIAGISVFHESLGQGLPLVCLHGYGVDHRSIRSGMESVLADVPGLERIYFDLPGMGQSQTHPDILSSDDMLEMVLRFIDRCLGPDRAFAIAGYSYGGYLARGVLAQMPGRVKGMMLLCPVIRFRRSARTLPPFKCCERDPGFIEALPPEALTAMEGFITVQIQAVWEQYLTHIHPSLDLADQRLMRRIRDTEFSRDPDRGSAYDGPALMLLGRHDVSVGYEDALRLSSRFTDGDVVVAGRAGHLLHMEQPGLFRFHVRTWARRLLNH
ncbi:MAG: alpha/beta hydrolase [Desulfobacter sp.]|nr:MAG: alpha/beta hydrolase [Desulfobacter sp.]